MNALLGKEIYSLRKMELERALLNGVRMRKFFSLIFARFVMLIEFFTVFCKSFKTSVGKMN